MSHFLEQECKRYPMGDDYWGFTDYKQCLRWSTLYIPTHYNFPDKSLEDVSISLERKSKLETEKMTVQLRN